jgi:hypothetical protein
MLHDLSQTTKKWYQQIDLGNNFEQYIICKWRKLTDMGASHEQTKYPIHKSQEKDGESILAF